MLRRGGTRALLCWASAEAALQGLNDSARAVSLVDAIGALNAFGKADAAVARRAMEHVVALDADDAASAQLAEHRAALLEVAKLQPEAAGEAVCRTIANMAMLPDPAAAGDEEAASEAPAGVITYASALEREGALQLVLSVMERGERLSPKGRAWTAMALTNLCMFDDAAARAAASTGAAAAAAGVLRLALAAIEEAGPADAGAADFAAADSALAVIPRLLSLQVAVDSTASQYYYQTVPFAVVEAVALAMSRSVSIAMTHKAWEAMRLIAAEPANHAMIFNGLHAADGVSGTKVLRAWIEATAEAFQRWQPNTTNPEVSHEQLLRWQATLSGLETLTSITSAVNDNVTGAGAADEPVSDDVGPNAEADADEDEEDAKPSFSRHGLEDDASPASVSALAALSSGVLSKFAISIVSSTPPEVLAPRGSDGRDESVLLGCVSLLSNLAESDPYVSSANCVAALVPLIDPFGPVKYSAPVVEKVLAVLWNILNHTAGADAVATLNVGAMIKKLSVDPNAAETTRVMAGRVDQKIQSILEQPRYARDNRGSK